MKYRRIVAIHSSTLAPAVVYCRFHARFCFFFCFLLDARASDAYLLRFIFISLVRLSRGENLSGFCRRFHSMLKDYARTASTVAAAAASATPSNGEMARPRKLRWRGGRVGKPANNNSHIFPPNTEWLWQCVVSRRRTDAPNISNRM